VGYYCDSECGQLIRVALASPACYRQTVPINRRQEREALQRPVDRDRLLDEHAGLRRALLAMGVDVVDVDPHPDLPYLLNIRDPVVVIDSELVQFQMGEPLRRAEPAWVVSQLGVQPDATLAKGMPGATLEGGDVFQVGGALIVGVSQRTSNEGAVALLGHLGREIHPVELETGVLHLDTVFNVVGGLAIVAEQGIKDVRGLVRLLAGLGVAEVLTVSAADVDDYATNFLCIDDRRVLIGAGSTTLQASLATRGIDAATIEMSEHHRIGGSVRCATLVLQRAPLAA
jgi:N-dimethylarginine dimethylaminohydrolase